jgi:phosphotransferase system enzyme I (PtsP)
MTTAQEEITRQSQRIAALVGEDHGAILQAQLLIMQDRAIEQDLADCLDAGRSAEQCVLQTLNKYVTAFQKVATPFFQERIYDIKDIFRRILWHLQPRPRHIDTSGDQLVLVAREASVMDLFAVDLDQLAAVIVGQGGPQSHVAILARSLGVPMIGQVPDFVRRVASGRRLLIDATCGTIYVDPSAELVTAHSTPRKPPSRQGVGKAPMPAGLPRVEANINLVGEVTQALEQGAVGVGLYRSEFLFLARRTFPTEEEQADIYRKLLGALRGRPASIRTFDLRPDKVPPAARLPSKTVQAVDWRLVLVSPSLQQVFKGQVRAILRAAVAGPVRLLIPLVTRTEQLDFVVDTVAQARAELHRDGLEFDSQVPLGVMIETAAAIPMIVTWASQVDFFALGTNDLIASALGIDRDDPVGGSPNDPLHPGLLRLIGGAVAAAHQARRPITVCGEMAADPDGAVALAALQVDALSVAVNHLDAVRGRLIEQSAAALAPLGRQLADLRSGDEARNVLRHWGGPRQAV